MFRCAPASSAVNSDSSVTGVNAVYPRITGLRLGLLTAEEIERNKGAVLTEHMVYARNLPKLDGPNDPGMGPSDRRVLCNTCRCSWFKCPGHPGVLRLPVPLYHVGFIATTFKLLQAVCWCCSSLKGTVPDPVPGAKPGSQFSLAFEAGKGRFKCPSCQCPQPQYKKSGPMSIRRVWKPAQLQVLSQLSPGLRLLAERPFTPADALAIFEGMTDAAIVKAGMDPVASHPKALILQNVAVLPPNARPAIMAAEGSKRKGQDDITSQLQDIVKACRALRRAMAGAQVESTATPEYEYANNYAKVYASLAVAAAAKASGSEKAATAATTAAATAAAPSPTPIAVQASKAKRPAAKRAKGKSSSAPSIPADHGPNEGEGVSESKGDDNGSNNGNTPGLPPVALTVDNLYLPWSSEVVDALRQVLPDVVATITPVQAAAAWNAFPVQCERLQDQVTVMINNGGRFAPLVRQRTGVAKRSLVARLVGKQGRLRGNIFARRTDQNARSVIKPDRWLDIDQLGVPRVFMNTLTKPEEVHRGNLDRLQAAVKLGPGQTGGAARVLRADGRLIQLHLLKPGMPPVVLQPGDVVERHLIDGDVGIFNRQPTLHRLGMMAHRLKAIQGEAFGLPLGVMGPYNADCDGDEMNLHVLQSIHGDAEARMLLAVQANVINPQTNAPCVSLVQDARVGAMLLTRSSTLLDEGMAHACAAAIHYKLPRKETLPAPCCKDPATGKPMWSGRQIVSMLIPQGVSLTRRVRGAGPEVGPEDPEDRFIQVVDGELVHGALCKTTLGTGSGSLIHRVHLVAGPRAVIQFLSDFQRVVYTWMPMRGFTMGLQDCLASPASKQLIHAAVKDADETVEALTRRAAELGAGALAPAEAATLEAHLLTILTSVLDYGSRCVLEDGDCGGGDRGGGGFRAMVAAGSKGNTNNVAQVMACLGQQVIEGGRVAPGGANQRTLPCFPEGAFSAAARGFIAHSYTDGISPAGYYYHMVAGREGLTATAVKTSETGYKYRVMAKAMETNTVRWDGTVRNGQSYILECVAGGDCCAATAVQRVDMTACIHATYAELVDRIAGPGWATMDVTQQEHLVARVAYAKDLQARLRVGLFTPCLQGSTTILLPVHPADEIAMVATSIAAGRVRLEASCPQHLDLINYELRCAVDDLIRAILRMLPVPEAGTALCLAMLWDMTPDALHAAGVHTACAFRETIGAAVYERFLDALVAPGESVGIVAAQSIGEPSTQLTLNVFHHAGMLDRHLTSGVPRLKELLHAAPKIRTPSTIAPVKPGAFPDSASASKAALSLQFLCLDTAVHSSYVVQDPVEAQTGAPWTTILKDSALMQHVHEVFGPEPVDASPWVIRMTLHRAMLAEAGLTPESVARAIADQLPASTSASLVYSEPNMRRWVVRIRTRGENTEHEARVLHSHLREAVLLGGIHGVRAARIIDQKHVQINETTGAVETHTRTAVDMEGTALRELATRDWVQWESVITNDVLEVASVLGLVAARAVLFAELDRVISTGGGHVDPRHLAQVVATMTHRGVLMPLTRHGINRVNMSVLQRTSFEEPVDMLLQGAVQGQRDPLRGLCECVYVGAKPPVGTGTVAVQEDYIADAAINPARATVSSREMRALPGQGKHFRSARKPQTPHRPRHAHKRPRHQAPATTGHQDTILDAEDLTALLDGGSVIETQANGQGQAVMPSEHETVATGTGAGTGTNIGAGAGAGAGTGTGTGTGTNIGAGAGAGAGAGTGTVLENLLTPTPALLAQMEKLM